MRKIFYLLMTCLLASTLEAAMLNEQFDLQKLKGKRLGYYIGSFDPIHLGHQFVIESALQEGHVDYVLIYPAPGGDSFKNRTPLPVRKKMIGSLYQDEPKVLLTDWSPRELQEAFEEVAADVTVIGIIGSDVITEKFFGPDKELGAKYLKVFMRGLPIEDRHAEDTAGALIALKASGFLVSLRGDVDLSFLMGAIHDRPILGSIQSKDESSTRVRKAVEAGHSIDSLVAPSVQDIIEDEGLYLTF